MKLRDYQEAAVKAVLEAWKEHPSCMVVLPTGCGKTVVFGDVIKERLAGSGRAMVLAHREELIDQAAEKIRSITGAEVGIEMGDRAVEDTEGLFNQKPSPVVVSSVQTQVTGRMGKFDPAEFTTLVIDEAHHATSKSYRACIDHYLENPDCRLLGVTATPDRADETALGLVFDTVAFEYTVSDAIRDGWLVPVKQKLVTVKSLDFSKVSTTAGDLNQGELDEIMKEERNLHAVAGPTAEICGKRRAIVFAVSVAQAERLAEIINRNKETGQAAWLCGKTPKGERQRILRDFKDGKLQYVVNVGVLTEGFDDAGVEVVVMARPTKSRALYAQMAGRATRPAAEIAADLGNHDAAERTALIAASSKPECLIVDFVGNSGRHKLMTTTDILGGNFDVDDEDEEEARRAVREKCEKTGEELDTMEELEKARAAIKARKLADAARRAFIQAQTAYSVTSIDPFNVYDLAPLTKQERMTNRIQLSYKQRELLRNALKVDPDRISPAEGRALVNEFFWRLHNHLATLGQTKYLRQHGFPAPMGFDEASRTIGEIMARKRNYRIGELANYRIGEM